MDSICIELYSTIYGAIYVSTINRFIDEDLYIKVLKAMCFRGFKTYTVNNFSDLVAYLYFNNFRRSYNVSVLFYLRDSNLLKIDRIAKEFLEINCYSDQLHKIKHMLKHNLDIVRAFRKIEKIESIFVESEYNSYNFNNFNKVFVENEWIYWNRLDIFDRLFDLRKIFNVPQLVCANVEPIKAMCLERLDVLDLQIYYNRTIDSMINSIESWIIMVDLYVDSVDALESDYRLKKFKISIKRKKD